MSAAGRALFVYWRVRPDAVDDALAALRRLQSALCDDHPGLRAARYQRDGEPPTLMETYAIDGGIDTALQADIERRIAPALAVWAAGARHVEVFVPR